MRPRRRTRRPRRHPGVTALAAASGVLAGLAAYSRVVVRRAEREFPATGALIEVDDDAILHAVERGSGPPVVIIHGADGVLQSFTETVVDDLASTGRRVIAVDRPGHGWSTLPSGSKPDLGLDVALIREGVRRLGVERPILVGHSYGGAVAMRWALDHPGEVRALVLLAPVAAFPWEAPLWMLGVASVPVLGRVLTEALVVPLGRPVLEWAAGRGFRPADVPGAYREYATALYLRPSQFRALAAECRALPADVRALTPRFPDLGALPVEIVVGSEDAVAQPHFHARPLAWAVPGANLVELPGVGHELMWDRPDAVIDAVARAEARAR